MDVFFFFVLMITAFLFLGSGVLFLLAAIVEELHEKGNVNDVYENTWTGLLFFAVSGGLFAVAMYLLTQRI